MLRQESSTAKPFVEEEISEAVLEPLRWRAEGRAERPVTICGGVLADEVGYGKTAITLGLIDSSLAQGLTLSPPVEQLRGVILVKATLIVVPSHLIKQWPAEITKFVGKALKVIPIITLANLNKLTVAEIESADIIVVSATIFKSEAYWSNLAALAGAGPLPAGKSGDRHFVARLKKTLAGLRDRVEELSTMGQDGVQHVLNAIEATRNGVTDDVIEESTTAIPSKRLKGNKYSEQNDTTGLVKTVKKVKRTEKHKVEKKSPRKEQTIDSILGSTMEAERKSLRLKRKIVHEQIVIPDDSPPSTPIAQGIKGNYNPGVIFQDSDDDAIIIISEDEGKKVAITTSMKQPVISRIAPKSARICVPKKSAPKKTQRDDDDDEDFKLESEEGSEESEEEYEEQEEEENEEEEEDDNHKQEEEEEEEDEPPKKKTKSNDGSASLNKTSTKAKKETVKKKVTREERDPWNLNSSSVKRDWKQMKSPPLEMFHFNRIVVDEFTYLSGREHCLITNLKATFRWCLSGTPPVADFAAVKGIAVFLGIHLGVDDDNEGNSESVKKRRKELTAAEKFHSFREVHTHAWHARRHQLAQTFLDQFVRQNIAEIDEIPYEEHIIPVTLPAAERAIYLELEHHLQAMEMNTKKTIKNKNKGHGDRERRLTEALGQSKSPEEALLKRCSHFDIDLSIVTGTKGKQADNPSAEAACEVIVRERTKQLNDCKAEIVRSICEALGVQSQIKLKGGFAKGEEQPFARWQKVVRSEGIGDQEADQELIKLLDEAGCSGDDKSTGRKSATKLVMGEKSTAISSMGSFFLSHP